MKKIIFLLSFVAAATGCFAQTTSNTKPVIGKNYLQKSKNQKIAAWVLLGGGALIDIAGVIVYPKNSSWLSATSAVVRYVKWTYNL